MSFRWLSNSLIALAGGGTTSSGEDIDSIYVIYQPPGEVASLGVAKG
jgi:hypothetical protein